MDKGGLRCIQADTRAMRMRAISLSRVKISPKGEISNVGTDGGIGAGEGHAVARLCWQHGRRELRALQLCKLVCAGWQPQAAHPEMRMPHRAGKEKPAVACAWACWASRRAMAALVPAGTCFVFPRLSFYFHVKIGQAFHDLREGCNSLCYASATTVQ